MEPGVSDIETVVHQLEMKTYALWKENKVLRLLVLRYEQELGPAYNEKHMEIWRDCQRRARDLELDFEMLKGILHECK